MPKEQPNAFPGTEFSRPINKELIYRENLLRARYGFPQRYNGKEKTEEEKKFDQNLNQLRQLHPQLFTAEELDQKEQEFKEYGQENPGFRASEFISYNLRILLLTPKYLREIEEPRQNQRGIKNPHQAIIKNPNLPFTTDENFYIFFNQIEDIGIPSGIDMLNNDSRAIDYPINIYQQAIDALVAYCERDKNRPDDQFSLTDAQKIISTVPYIAYKVIKDDQNIAEEYQRLRQIIQTFRQLGIQHPIPFLSTKPEIFLHQTKLTGIVDHFHLPEEKRKATNIIEGHLEIIDMKLPEAILEIQKHLKFQETLDKPIPEQITNPKPEPESKNLSPETQPAEPPQIRQTTIPDTTLSVDKTLPPQKKHRSRSKGSENKQLRITKQRILQIVKQSKEPLTRTQILELLENTTSRIIEMSALNHHIKELQKQGFLNQLNNKLISSQEIPLPSHETQSAEPLKIRPRQATIPDIRLSIDSIQTLQNSTPDTNNDETTTHKNHRGRPKGSKNKPKLKPETETPLDSSLFTKTDTIGSQEKQCSLPQKKSREHRSIKKIPKRQTILEIIATSNQKIDPCPQSYQATENIEINLTPIEQTIYQTITKNPSILNRQIALQLDIYEAKVSNYRKKLIGQGLLHQKSNRETIYEICIYLYKKTSRIPSLSEVCAESNFSPTTILRYITFPKK